MSDENEKRDDTNDEAQLTDESLDAVAGGVIDGGCIRPIVKPLPFPIPEPGPYNPIDLLS